MSDYLDRDHSDGDVLEVLDRAAAATPPLHLAREDVVARGQQLVRRRRTARSGMGLGALALAGALWVGTGGPGLLGTTDVATTPAGTTWEVPDAGPGDVITLLGEEYTVGVDPFGWPQLAAEDGSVFLRISDDQGPSDGGMVHMGRDPLQGVQFFVDGQAGGTVDGEVVERVTIVGPAGKVRLLSFSQ